MTAFRHLLLRADRLRPVLVLPPDPEETRPVDLDADHEEWRPAVDLDGYEVSSLGAVRSVDRVVACADGRARRFRGQPIKGGYDKRLGYYRVVLFFAGKAVGRTVHSMVAEAFIGPRPLGQEVRHKNGVHGDCRAVNLEYGSRSDNQNDQVRHGTHPSASKTSCRRGHQLVEPNLVRAALPRRDCKACARARANCRQYPIDDSELAALANLKYTKIMGESA